MATALDDTLADASLSTSVEKPRGRSQLDLLSKVFDERLSLHAIPRQRERASSGSPVCARRGRARSGSPCASSGNNAQLRVPKVLWARDSAEIRFIPDVLSDFEIAHLLETAMW